MPNKDVFQQARDMYPALRDLDINYKISNNPQDNRKLEFFPQNERGSPNSPRPRELPINKLGMEIYNEDVRPLDVLADVTSHHLIYNDPTYKKYYDDFVNSFTPEQEQRLKGQYEYSVKNNGEERPFEQWAETTGLPGYFRGYAFKQWPDDFNKNAYTSDQLDMFDLMMNQLTGTLPSSRAKIIE